MAFPTTGVLDTFNRADENPLSDGGNWGGNIAGGTERLRVVTNEVTHDAAATSGLGSAYRSNLTYGPGSEAYVTITAKFGAAAALCILWLRAQSPGTAGVDGYALRVKEETTDDTWEIYTVTDNVFTLLGATVTQEIAVGDSVGFEAVGNVLTAYYKPAAGSWAALFSRTDTGNLYPNAGNIGLSIARLNSAVRLDGFGGGTVAPIYPVFAIRPGSTPYVLSPVTLVEPEVVRPMPTVIWYAVPPSSPPPVPWVDPDDHPDIFWPFSN